MTDSSGTSASADDLGGVYRPQENVKTPERALGNLVGTGAGAGGFSATAVPVAVEPTQVRRPWRSTARTVFQALIGLCVLIPVLVGAAGLDPAQLPWLGVVLAVAAAVTRVMAIPGVEEWLRRFLPFLAAAPAASTARPLNDPQHRAADRGAADLTIMIVTSGLILAMTAAAFLATWLLSG